MTHKYPTKAAILKDLYVPSKDEIEAIEKWKLDWYSTGEPEAISRLRDKWEDEHPEDWGKKYLPEAVKRWDEHQDEMGNHTPWSGQRMDRKWVALNDLINTLCAVRSAVQTQIVVMDQPWQYYPDKDVIVGERNNPSIISALHELGHHLYGETELAACTFSIGIFQACFPKAYAKLKWSGHELKNRHTV